MPQIDNDHVKLCGGIIVWDGVSRPEQTQYEGQAPKTKYTLKVVFPPTCPDLAIFDRLASTALLNSEFKGTLPHGGRMPISPVQPGEFNDLFRGWYVISFKTVLKCPDIYAMNPDGVTGQQVTDFHQWSPRVYAGQQVDVLAHCYPYNSKGNKGIAAGLDGFSYSVNSQAPRLAIGGGGPDTSAAFGATSTPAQAQQPYGAPAQAHGYLPQ